VRPPCEVMVFKLLPALRALISHYLINEYGFTQDQVAQALGVTQASISRSLSQLDRFEQYYTPLVQQTAHNFASQLSQGTLGLEEGIAALCTFCSSQKIGGLVCKLHREEKPELKECVVCVKGYISNDRIDVLNRLIRSVEILAETPEFTPFIPQVGSQLVMSIKEPQDITDVAGFPSRIVSHEMRPHSFTRPKFQGSYHLSKILLVVQQLHPELSAAIVFKYLEGLEEVFEQLGFKYTEVTRQQVNGVRDTDEALLAGIRVSMQKAEAFDVLIDKGLVGIEPVVYLLAPDADHATESAIQIAKQMTKAVEKSK
jgi:predicted fused transcriptional regulator/phosphomethylpyrimidine kinase/predicted transcriptional regulator